MKNQWIISSIATVIIWAIGAYSFYFVNDVVPNQLNTPSTILASKHIEKGKGTLLPESREIKEIIHETQKVVVHIELTNGSIGSGFLYNDKGDVVTNAHVVAGATEVKIITTDSREFTGKVIGISEDIDVAVVRVEGIKDLEPLKVSRDKLAEIGDEVLALGSPLGLQNTVTTGIISGINRDFDLPPYRYKDVYQVSAPIAPGNSGGPLIDSKTGKVIGINSAGYNQGSIGFSIPLRNVIALIEGWSNTPMTKLPDIVEDAFGYYNGEVGYSNEDLARYLVRYFYESLNYEDYVTAYSLLGSSWQTNVTYESFREGYLNTEAVVINDLVVRTEPDLTVVAIITAEERRNGIYVNTEYKVTYTVGYENDQFKIISGTGEKIK